MDPMDQLIDEWTRVSRHDPRIDRNAQLLDFLGKWLYSQYQPFPEKPPFWARLFRWLDHLPKAQQSNLSKRDQTRTSDQQALFNFIPWLLFVSSEDLIATYRAAYTGPICRWLLKQANIPITTSDLESAIADARSKTWFGSLAGMDINTFCRVNGIFGQSFRPEFRFIAEFCSTTKLAKWLKSERYERIVIIEDIVGTGTQLNQSKAAIAGLKKFPTLFVPLFIAPQGYEQAKAMTQEKSFKHFTCDPVFVLPHQCMVSETPSPEDSTEVTEFREVNRRRNHGNLGYGIDYGTLILTHANCPDNVPPIIYERTNLRRFPLFPRASREG